MKIYSRLLLTATLATAIFFPCTHLSSVIASRAYVSNEDDNSISIIDTASNIVIQTINLVEGGSPTGIAITPDDTQVFVVDKYLNNVTVIDIASNKMTKQIKVGDAPQWVAVTPDGKKAYVTNSGSNTISVIDIASSKVVETILVGNNPYEVVITPDGTKVLTTNYFDGTISVISVASNEVINTISVGIGPILVAIAPDGKKAYVTNNGGTTVSVVDIPSNSVIKTISVGINPFGIAVTPDGKKVFVGNNTSNTVSVIDANIDAVVNTITLPTETFPHYVAINPDGTEVYILDNNNNNITVINVSTEVPSLHISVGNSPAALAFIPLPMPPRNISGKKIADRFFNGTDYVNKIIWEASLDPLVTGYILSRNGKQIASIKASGPFSFSDHNRRKNARDIYTLTAINGSGVQSIPITLKIR